MRNTSKKAVSGKNPAEPRFGNWMRLDIAPLIAQRMYSKKPLPGTAR